jgi:hypothetical protein
MPTVWRTISPRALFDPSSPLFLWMILTVEQRLLYVIYLRSISSDGFI